MALDLSIVLKVVPPLILIEGLYSGSEIALLSADKVQLKSKAAQGFPGARLALELASRPERVLSCTLVMTALCAVGVSAILTLYCNARFPEHPEAYAVAVASPLIVFLGELIPKTLYQRYANLLAPFVSYPVQGAFWLFYPITKLLSFYTAALSRLLRPIEELLTGKEPGGRDELMSLLSYGRRESEITTTEKRMIKRIFDFKGTQARQIMIPLIKVEAIEQSLSIKDALERFKTHRHSRMPVYAGRIDNIVGVLEVSDLFRAQDTSIGIRNFIASAHYVAGTHLLDDLLTEMRREDSELVVVVDEYGGAVGILTFEDIVEEITGEIADEHDDTNANYKMLGERRYLIQGRMEIAEINEQLRLDLPEGDYETISGFLLQQFAKLPEVGDELYFDTAAGQLKFAIRNANERTILSVMVEVVSPRKPESDSASPE